MINLAKENKFKKDDLWAFNTKSNNGATAL